MVTTKRVGVLALQGGYERHIHTIRQCGSDAVMVRSAEELKEVTRLIIPGGESTTISKLLVRFDIFRAVKEKICEGTPVFATCAGVILLSKSIENFSEPHYDFLNIKIKRNAYGRQIDSFEKTIDIPVLGEKPFSAIFIRAPKIIKTGGGVDVLASETAGGSPVLIRQKNILAATFHPEMTDDLRVHKYFLDL